MLTTVSAAAIAALAASSPAPATPVPKCRMYQEVIFDGYYDAQGRFWPTTEQVTYTRKCSDTVRRVSLRGRT